MAFSFRKIISNINYFKRPEEQDFEEHVKTRRHTYVSNDVKNIINFEEADSTSRQMGLVLPDTVKNFAVKKASLSDTDLLMSGSSKTRRRKSKKLKLDIEKASRSMTEPYHSSKEDINVENTPKHILLKCQSSDIFSERFKGFDFNKSFEIDDAMIDEASSSPFEEENYDIQSFSDQSDSESSVNSHKPFKMCRKVEANETKSSNEDPITAPSATPESFEDFEIDRNEEERMKLLIDYQNKFESIQCLLSKLLTDFQFHIEFSKVFKSRSIITAPPNTDVSSIPKSLGEVTYLDNVSREPSPAGSWNIVLEKEDKDMKIKVKNQLQAIKHTIDFFMQEHLQNYSTDMDLAQKQYLARQRRSITFDIHKGQKQHKRINITPRKKIKYFDFPDLREAMINLFSLEPVDDTSISGNNVTMLLSDSANSDSSKCHCTCHCQYSPSSETEEGVNKSDGSLSSITSSIGNFSLDSTTLTAYSESLDQIVSYNSFQDTSLFSELLQKAAIERITFYVQVHSIQLKCEQFDSKNIITFHCPSCKSIDTEENDLLKHILSQGHCEKIHFLYKTAYIKKCVSAGKEIQPSTVLNSMKMYRDENKIVCFGDALYACSLCFENLIVGESILMAHCSDPQHINRKEKLNEIE